jgi:hypothetical protein
MDHFRGPHDPSPFRVIDCALAARGLAKTIGQLLELLAGQMQRHRTQAEMHGAAIRAVRDPADVVLDQSLVFASACHDKSLGG